MNAALLQEQVKQAYSRIAVESTAPFANGRQLAENLGYPVDHLPAVALEAFCGVAAVGVEADLNPGDMVLDLACGSGLDSVLAAQRGARVVAVDFSLPMLKRAQRAARQAGMQERITFLQSPAQELPLSDASVEVALVNGLFNLSPYRAQIFNELARVVRPGGKVYAAELILEKAWTQTELKAANWFT